MGRLLTRLGGAGATGFSGKRKNTISLIGHSLAANNGTADATWGSPGISPSGTGATWSKGVFERAMILLGQPLRIVSQQGISGQTSSQILARFDSAIAPPLAPTPGWLYLDAISNDSQASVPAATTIANIRQMIQRAKDAGIMVILALDPARSGYSQAQINLLSAVNRYFRDYCQSADGVIVFDQAPYFYNQTTFANSHSLPETTRMLNESSNYIHPNAKGAGFAAMGLAALLRPYFSYPQAQIGTFNNDGSAAGDLTNILRSPTLYGTGGNMGAGITGQVASTAYVQRSGGTITATASVVTRASLAGLFGGIFDDGSTARVQKLAIANSGGLGEQVQFFMYATTAPAGGSGPYIAEIDFAASCSSGTIETVQGHLSVGSSPAWAAELNLNIDSGDTLGLTSFAGRLRSHPFYMPQGTIAVGGNETGLGIFFATSAGAACDAYVANPAIRLLTA